MKLNLLKILRNPFFIVAIVLIVAISIKSNYSSQEVSSQSLEVLEKKVDDHVSEIITQLDGLKELIKSNKNAESANQMRYAISSRENICSLDEKEYIKKIDLNNIKSKFNDDYTYHQTDFYLKMQKNLVKMLSAIDIGKKYSVDYPNYINSYALKIKSTIDNYSDCSAKNIISASEYEIFLKNYDSYELESIEKLQENIKIKLASLK